MYMYVSVFCVYTPPMVVYVLDILDWLWNFYCFRFILWYTIFVNFFLKSEHWYFFISWDSNLSQDSNNVDKSIFLYESFIKLNVEAEHSRNDILVKYLYIIKPSFMWPFLK